MSLKVEGLRVSVEGKRVLRGVDVEIGEGEVVALVGANGSGKSSLAYALMGKDGYEVEEGKVGLDGKDLLEMGTNERAKAGLLLVFQEPVEVGGVSVGEVVVSAWREKDEGMRWAWEELMEKVAEGARILGLKKELLERGLNEGFSGGEKKKMEMLQMLSLRPKYVILDEVDSGLDKKSLTVVGKLVNELRKEGCGFLVISHGEKLLKDVKPERTIYLNEGKVKKVKRRGGK